MAESAKALHEWQLSDRGRQEIERRWPKLDVRVTEAAAHIFRQQMSIQEEHGDAKWEDEVARLTKTSQAFLTELENAQWTAFSFGRVSFGGRQLWLPELLTKFLRVFVRLSTGYQKGGLERDRRHIPGPRADFVLRVSKQLEIVGYGITARATDDLVRVMDLLFEESGHPVKDPRKTVAHILKHVGTD
ncbi:hypothetical protein [Erythrobacter alti]|uniref:hypothetical protein n=1 Tax=Erythrobacter alti TaxID=1896145 RepID=UPI0030F3FC3B